MGDAKELWNDLRYDLDTTTESSHKVIVYCQITRRDGRHRD